MRTPGVRATMGTVVTEDLSSVLVHVIIVSLSVPTTDTGKLRSAMLISETIRKYALEYGVLEGSKRTKW